jgi:hypothetical protein
MGVDDNKHPRRPLALALTFPIAPILETTLSRHRWAVLSQQARRKPTGASGGGVLRHAQARSTREAGPGTLAVSATVVGMGGRGRRHAVGGLERPRHREGRLSNVCDVI